MVREVTRQGWLRPGGPLRTSRAAAVAGIVFAVLLITALVLLRISVPARPGVPGAWLTDSGRRAAVAIALNLIPFAGIAFLWFIGVLRDRIGEREDRLFATVFLGSGLLFVGMLFVAAAVAGATVAAASSTPPGTDVLDLSRNLTASLLNVYTMRMAAVFTLTTANIARRTAIVSRWLILVGLACALTLLIGIGISPWVELVFPAWILALSLEILVAGPAAPAVPGLFSFCDNCSASVGRRTIRRDAGFGACGTARHDSGTARPRPGPGSGSTSSGPSFVGPASGPGRSSGHRWSTGWRVITPAQSSRWSRPPGTGRPRCWHNGPSMMPGPSPGCPWMSGTTTRRSC
jgi:hypothetical protein